ncbi:murein hydrolase activator EnvC family protein [Leeia oryzae]|uniref:murein hydrolase activator EnvC family protein n=1 Tax=Leeia oryzae TaxID=356662 RepID=UPI0003A32085|nr:peptidoglycan DD-metalloendopeptidase family protein [Leeia oryzae]
MTQVVCAASNKADTALPQATTGQLNNSKAELNDLQKQIQQMQQAVAKSEQTRKDASDALQQSESAISNANRTLADLADEKDQLQDQLQQLGQQSQRLHKAIESQKAALGHKLKAQYKNGNSDSLRLLLGNTDPNTATRDLAYLRYIAAAHQAQVNALQQNLSSLKETESGIQERQQKLTTVEQQRQTEKQQLETEKANRAATLAKVSTQLSQQRQQIDKLKRDQARLSELVDQLTKIIAEQERQRQIRLKAEAAAKAKAEKLAREQQLKAEKLAKQHKNTGKAGKTTTPGLTGNDATVEPPVAQVEKPVTKVTLPADNTIVTGNAQALKGKLIAPISGSPSNRFGAPRADSGVAWRGWFYPASEGADIRSVAAGQVVYADWLRGFGNMIIVDHGGGLMSIYGSAESVLKHVGDRVDAGQTIAKAGNSGGSDKQGLYFELRYKGKAFDPAGWLRG